MALMSFTFGGVTSSDYGIYIGGEGTFNAPKRAVETISIPGRNGDFILDKGRFENITLTYTAINYEKDLLTFAQNLSDFRNALAAQKGYQRLTDSFNPTEYRMACFVDGVEIDPIKYNTASQFEITFNCKPQRYLMSGESEIDVTTGDTIFNPTLFEAHPLLEAEGYGAIVANGYEINIANATLGDVVVADAVPNVSSNPIVQTLDTNLFNTGDDLTVKAADAIKCRYRVKSSVTELSTSDYVGCQVSYSSSTRILSITIEEADGALTAGTSENAYFDAEFGISYVIGQVQTAGTVTVRINRTYDPQTNTITHEFVPDTALSEAMAWIGGGLKAGEVIADSSLSILGTPTYIDCDLGEVYKLENGSYVSLNRYIDLGSKLPELSPGTNVITYENTITDLKVKPRWWKV